MPSQFLVVRTPDHLARACADVSTLTLLQHRGADTETAPLLGVWVERPSESGDAPMLATPASLSTGPCPLVLEVFELAGVWALCWTPPLSRTGLIDALMTSLSADSVRHGRFMPVFPEGASDWRHEWQALATRHAGLLPPVRQGANGRLQLDDLWWAAPPVRSRPRSGDVSPEVRRRRA